MPILGIIASSISGNLEAGDFESIATTTVGSGGAANVEFTSIPATFTHLQVRITARSTGSLDVIYRLNGDTTAANYRTHLLYGDGTNATSATIANQAYITDIASTSTIADAFGVAVVDFLDYANTNKYKVSRSLGGFDRNGATGYILLISSLWQNTNAITSITMNPITGSFAQYSSFALYGIRSA
jgi:hypothetical protein